MAKKCVVIDPGTNPLPIKFNYFKNARSKCEIKIATMADVIINDKKIIMDTPEISFIIDSLIIDVKNNIAEKIFTFYNVKVDHPTWLKDFEWQEIHNNFKYLEGFNGQYNQDQDGIISNFIINSNIIENKYTKSFIENYKNSLVLNNVIFHNEALGEGAVWTVYEKNYKEPENNAIYDVITTNNITKRTGQNIKFESTNKLICTDEHMEFNEKNNILKFFGSSESRITLDLVTAEREVSSVSILNITTKNKSQISNAFEKVIITCKFVY